MEGVEIRNNFFLQSLQQFIQSINSLEPSFCRIPLLGVNFKGPPVGWNHWENFMEPRLKNSVIRGTLCRHPPPPPICSLCVYMSIVIYSFLFLLFCSSVSASFFCSLITLNLFKKSFEQIVSKIFPGTVTMGPQLLSSRIHCSRARVGKSLNFGLDWG